VVVAVGLSIEPGTQAVVLNASNHPKLDKCIEDSVHRRSGKTGNLILNILEYLIGRWMVFPLQDCLKDIATLHRQRQAPFATKGLEIVQSPLDFLNAHIRQMLIVTNRYRVYID
jgi:hypothetical protein